jgi:hypothetical protein
LPGTAAYRAYAQQHAKIRRLIAEAADLPTASSRELAFRGIAVLIVAEFEAYLRAILQDHVDSVAGAWDDMAPAQQIVVADQIVSELSRLLDESPAPIKHPKDTTRIAERVRKVAAWLDSPGKFAADGVDTRVSSFHDSENVAKAVEKVLLLVRDDGVSFFDWLGSRGVDRESYKLALSGLVELRVDVAHQLGRNLQPTDVELRGHQRRLALLARSIRAYVRGAPVHRK